MKKGYLICIGLVLCINFGLVSYEIDVVVPCHEKDARTIDLVVEGIKKYGKDVRRVIVVSSKPLTEKAEWFDESLYPFNKESITAEIFPDRGARFRRCGWIYQQFLKLYAAFVIPDIAENVLIIDADTVFLNPVTFIDEKGRALYNVKRSHHKEYFEHGKRLLPDFKLVFEEWSGITHHMLFQRTVLQDFFDAIYAIHQCDAWRALCRCMDHEFVRKSCMSEYELYFNFIFSKNYDVKVRKLKWKNMKFNTDDIEACRQQGYQYASCHSYLKKQYDVEQ